MFTRNIHRKTAVYFSRDFVDKKADIEYTVSNKNVGHNILCHKRRLFATGGIAEDKLRGSEK